MRIAIIEDNQKGLKEIVQALSAHGDTCHRFEDASEFLRALPRDSFDVCVIDVELDVPGMDSIALVRALHERKQSMPVLVLTVAGSELGLVDVLDSHRDDFLVKPVRIPELRARLQVMLRRATPGNASGERFEYDRFELNLKTLQVRDGGKAVELTQKEFQLAILFLSNVGKPLSRSHIREAVWGRNSEVPSRTLDTHVSRVRTKLSLRPESGYLLAPVYSYGYRLENLRVAEEESDADDSKVAARGE